MSNDFVIRIQPEGGELEEHRFDPARFMTPEVIAIEKAVGLTWPFCLRGLDSGHALSTVAFVWILRKRQNPRIRFEDVQFAIGDCEVIDPDIDTRYDGTPDDEDGDTPTGEGDPKEPDTETPTPPPTTEDSPTSS